MDPAILAFTGSVATLITSLVVAHFNRRTAHQLEAIKAELHDIKNKSYFKFSKYHELQIEAIKLVYPKAIDLLVSIVQFEKQINSDNTDDIDKGLDFLQNCMEDFNITFRKNSIFLGSETADVIDKLLKPVQDYNISIKSQLLAMKVGDPEWTEEANYKRREMRIAMRKNVPLIIKQLEDNFKEVLVRPGG